MYGKLLPDGGMRPAPNTVIWHGRPVTDPGDDKLLELGYLPVVETPIPHAVYDDKHWEFYWQIIDSKIVKQWDLVDNPVYSPTKEELTAEFITMQINSFGLTPKQALHFAPLYPTFDKLIGQRKKQGYMFTYNDILYAVAQPELTFEAHYPPGDGTESLYERVDNMHDGTLADPIPAATNMRYYKDKYYIEDGVLYLCIRDSAQPLQHLPSELTGSYFILAQSQQSDSDCASV